MVARTDDFEPERLQGTDHAVERSVNGKLGPDPPGVGSRENSGLRDEGFQDRIFLVAGENVGTEGLQVKGDG